MSDKMPIIKRVFLAQPRRHDYRHATWVVRPVFNENTSSDAMLEVPLVADFAHEPYELYYHSAIVEKLRAILAVARMVNNSSPDPRMTHALKNYDEMNN